jgi:hypothetical protein
MWIIGIKYISGNGYQLGNITFKVSKNLLLDIHIKDFTIKVLFTIM